MRLIVQGLFFGLLTGVCTLTWAHQTVLEDARVSVSSGQTRAVLDLSSDLEPDLFLLANPSRLVIDLPDTRTARHFGKNAGSRGLIKRIRTGVHRGTGLRVVLDLNARVKPKSVMLAPSGQHEAYRLVVDLKSGHGASADHVAFSDDGSGASARHAGIRNQETGHKTEQEKSPAGHTRKKRVGYHPERPTKDIVVAIDAGHGGKDSGAHGPHGTLEKNVTLNIARRLKKMVDDQPHMHGVLTRKGDYYVGLRKRMVIARKDKADFFISIHCDASPHGGGARGASVYMLSRHGATSEHARWLAQRENAADMVGGVDIKDKNSSLASFMLDLSQSASNEASLDAGRRVLKGLGRLGGLHKKKVQQAAFVVLKSPDIPSILVETNFISNPREVRKLTSAHYQKALARSMLHGIKGYFSSYRPATYIAKGQQHKVGSGETLSGIAYEYGISVAALKEYNDLDSDMIHVGQKLKIPSTGGQTLADLH